MRAIRTLVWFWGTGGAGIRFAARVAECITVPLMWRSRCTVEMLGSSAPAAAATLWRAWGATRGHEAILSVALTAPSRWLALSRQIDNFKPDVVVIPMFALAWPLCLIPRMANIPIIYVAHDDRPHIGDYYPILQRRLQSALLQQASQTVALSQYVFEQILSGGQLLGKPHCKLIPLSAHDVAHQNKPKLAPRGDVSLLFLGRVLKYKGLLMLADALEAFRSRPGWRLTIAGVGPDTASIAARFRNFSQVDLSRLRVLNEAEVDALLEEHDVLICPYLEASQSGVISEALYHGMPSVVTPVGGLPEQIGFGKAGWITSSITAEGLQQVLALLLDDPTSIAQASAGALEMVAPERTRAWGELVDLVARRG